WYYLTPGNGSMKTGWQFINNKWYYLTPGNGSMKTGWQKINIKYYYLYSSGAMAADTWIGEYYVNRSGIWIP
ncbi:MAG: N-acetylmuramoyl-L-alanine amidase family protein, partial [Lachnospiraceae bacterium]|nr:N-acetylmuramoyl-L-alanine amidase family protein [Lachnospiraceae bacterium]